MLEIASGYDELASRSERSLRAIENRIASLVIEVWKPQHHETEAE